MVLSPASSSHYTRVICGGLPWPAIRGERLLRAFNIANPSQEEEEEDAFPYELELCVPTAGHLALVLVQRTPGVQLNNPPISHTTTQASPRVVYVLDALPHSYPRRKPREDNTRKKNTALGSQVPSHQVDELELFQELFAPHTRAAGGKEGSVVIKAPLLCARFDCRVVSIRFIRSAGNFLNSSKLCRNESKGLNDSFASVNSSTSSSSSSMGASSSSRVVGAAAPLRCIVAREDGMAFLWEWQADLFQWVFLNKLCFLENPNLKWTRPVMAFTTCDLPLDSKMSGLSVDKRGNSGNEIGSNGAAEIVWWSTATKHEPKLKIRRLRLERTTDALRATDVVVGSAFTPKPLCNDVVKLLSSKLGLFAISRTQGIFFRSSVASLKTVAMSWHKIFSLDEANTIPEMSQIMVCMHSVTGEIVVLLRESGEIYLVTPKPLTTSTSSSCDARENGSCTMIFARKLTTLACWQQFSSTAHDDDNPALDVLDIAAHRHVFLVLTRSVLYVYTLIAGKLLETVSLPDAIARSAQQHGCKFWTISGSASSVGLWAPCGFWTICLPLAKVVAAALHQPQSTTRDNRNDSPTGNDPEAAFQAVKDYGVGDLHLEAVRYALDVLERVTPSAMDPTQSHPEAWEAMWHTVSSPAFLLALLDNRATSDHVIHELAQHVSAIYNTASDIRLYGRLDGRGSASNNDNHLLRLTPANLESLHHLSNWIVLAKRKLARLETSSSDTLKSSPSVSSPRGSGSIYQAMSELTAILANEDDLSIAQDRQSNLQRKESVVDPKDVHNFRLSRKLRPMSSLRFAAGCSTSSERQGRQWLLQLESFLLDGVAFKDERQSGGACRVIRSEATPSHRLFHSERVLADFRHVTASSFSKHMYLESMSRLYLLYEPESLLPFIRCVERFCPRLFSLSGHQSLARSHAERALTLLPPLGVITNKVIESMESNDGQSPKASLLTYVDLLSYCGHHSEACRALLQCHLYEESKHKFLLLQKGAQDVQHSGDDEQVEKDQVRVTASNAVYFLLLEYCMNHGNSTELNALLMLKPANVDMLHVLKALRTAFSCCKNQRQQKGNRACATGITVGELRPVLAALMQQRRSGVAK
ncbi:unnamed protein product [Peronospora effusa]|nr:unnamed protein product [Peronospora effusa]